uniref:SSBM7=(GAL4(1-147))-SSBM7 transcriptional repressor component n=1 Tax=Escherichia coli TaxID=562 RepID=Q9R5Z3_ECOLX|nr:SSBM7=(GAL4(1-147))-SSBM7 transcriptional repressor component [Escherichia coli, Peptide, 69 aa] [Escherichia coli]
PGISSERAPRNVSKTARENAKKGDAGKKGGKRRQVGKKVYFEPDSASTARKRRSRMRRRKTREKRKSHR